MDNYQNNRFYNYSGAGEPRHHPSQHPHRACHRKFESDANKISSLSKEVRELRHFQRNYKKLKREHEKLLIQFNTFKSEHWNCGRIKTVYSDDEDWDLEEENELIRSDPSHPLLQFVILDNVFKYLSISELWKIRGTCKHWNLVINGFIKDGQNCITFSGETESQEKILALTEIFQSNPKFPLTRFTFEISFLTLRNEFLIQRFLPVAAPHMRNLTFTLSEGSSIDMNSFAYSLKHFFSRDFRSLSSLSFSFNFKNSSDLAMSYFGNFQHLRGCISLLTCHAPKLKSITILRSPLVDFANFEAGTELIEAIKSQVFNLEHLVLSIPIKGDQLGALTEEEMTLKTLVFDFKGLKHYVPPTITDLVLRKHIPVPPKYPFREFLQSTYKTLERIELENINDEEFSHLEQVWLPNLKELKIIRCQTDFSRIDYSLDFKRNLPRLVTLDMSSSNSKMTFFSANSTTSQSLRYLSLDSQIKHIQINYGGLPLAQNIARLFPNLKKLRIWLDPAFVQSVYKFLTNLEELTLVADEDDHCPIDSVITGISEDTCEELLRNSNMIPTVDLSDFQTELSIASLKKLKRLHLSSIQIQGENWDDLGLSNVSGYFLLQRMESLKILDFTRSKLTNECLEKLKEKYTVRTEVID